MGALLEDVRLAARLMLKNPGFAAVAVLTLALGIGANTTIFSIANALFLQPLPVKEPDRLVAVYTTDKKNPGFGPSSHLNWKDYRQREIFESMLGYDWTAMSVATGGKAKMVVGQLFRSAIVNESFAKRYLAGRNPLGARIGIGGGRDTRTDIEIVEVVKSFSYRGLRATEDQAFFPLFEGPGFGGSFYVRTRTPSNTAFASIRAAVRNADPNLPIDRLQTLDDQLDRALANERLLAMLASAFAGLAILLAAVGLYGVTSFVVSRRTREIGIRIALGASRAAALWLVVRDTAVMVALGVALALPAVFGLGRLIESQLFGVHAMDAATIAFGAAFVGIVALGAAALPARRAASVSPVEALRCE